MESDGGLRPKARKTEASEGATRCICSPHEQEVAKRISSKGSSEQGGKTGSNRLQLTLQARKDACNVCGRIQNVAKRMQKACRLFCAIGIDGLRVKGAQGVRKSCRQS